MLRSTYLHRVLCTDQACGSYDYESHSKLISTWPVLHRTLIADILSQSEPAACPFCVEPNFGVTYVPPPVNRRVGLGAPKVGIIRSLDQ